MDLRPGRRLVSRPPPQHDGAPCHRPGPGGADRISILSDDMILLVLERVRCVRTAVRTGVLSRRWRGLWTRITHLAFRGAEPATIEAAFSCFSAGSPVGTAFQLDILLPSRPEPAEADSLLHAAAMLSPAGLVFTIAPHVSYFGYNIKRIQLPCFQHATSMELNTLFVVQPPAAGEMERLSMSGRILNIDAMVSRCPRLRIFMAKFRGLVGGYISQVLDSLKRSLGSRKVAVSLIDISISERDLLLLRGAADLSPQELVYTNTGYASGRPGHLQLPFFLRTTSIKINQDATFTLFSYSGKFLALQRCLCGCNIDELGKFVSCCPCLRILRVDGATTKGDITVHSTSLEELVLGTYKECRGINIVTPELKQLTMEVHADGDLSTSVSAPIVEKVLWRRSYTGPASVFGFWLLRSLIVETAESNADRTLVDVREDDTLLQVQQLRRPPVLTVDMCASDSQAVELNIAREIEKLPVSTFSVVELRLEAMWHVYGATLLCLLQTLQVHNAAKILKITLLRSDKSEVTRACTESCSCDEPKNWRSQSISMTYLEEVEIIGFKGEDNGFDFLKVILRCAPMLKKVTIKLGNKIKTYAHHACTKKIYNISLECPWVNFYVYLSCGTVVLHPCLPRS